MSCPAESYVHLAMLAALVVAIVIGWVVFDIADLRKPADGNAELLKVAAAYVLATVATAVAFAMLLEDFVTRACVTP